MGRLSFFFVLPLTHPLTNSGGKVTSFGWEHNFRNGDIRIAWTWARAGMSTFRHFFCRLPIYIISKINIIEYNVQWDYIIIMFSFVQKPSLKFFQNKPDFFILHLFFFFFNQNISWPKKLPSQFITANPAQQEKKWSCHWC